MADDNDVEEALETIISAAGSLLAIVARSVESALGAVTLPQYRLLVILTRAQLTPVARLVELTGASAVSVDGMIRSMEKDGWISTAGTGTDSDPVVEVTVHGHQVVKHVTNRRRADIAAVLERMSEPDRWKVADALGRFAWAAGEPGPDDLQIIDTTP
jgi:DNA-binding MarR family transcriptional regulator